MPLPTRSHAAILPEANRYLAGRVTLSIHATLAEGANTDVGIMAPAKSILRRVCHRSGAASRTITLYFGDGTTGAGGTAATAALATATTVTDVTSVNSSNILQAGQVIEKGALLAVSVVGGALPNCYIAVELEIIE